MASEGSAGSGLTQRRACAYYGKELKFFAWLAPVRKGLITVGRGKETVTNNFPGWEKVKGFTHG